ncbi:hypothetical protein VRB23_09220 [Erwinia aphidicola]|uniref:hypothetical protein n=1 Tax=Erwinia aphidicola TaxID=68334 RepID=UPI0030D5460A
MQKVLSDDYQMVMLMLWMYRIAVQRPETIGNAAVIIVNKKYSKTSLVKEKASGV